MRDWDKGPPTKITQVYYYEKQICSGVEEKSHKQTVLSKSENKSRVNTTVAICKTLAPRSVLASLKKPAIGNQPQVYSITPLHSGGTGASGRESKITHNQQQKQELDTPK